jgi:ElaB/YqjD/DUF883 family membrane-anchored ribosome-binding protein
MSGFDGEDAIKGLTDKATYKRLEKDLAAVKNDIAALTEQITDALNAFTGEANKQARRTAKQARATAESMMSDASDRGWAAYETAQDTAYGLEESLEDAIQSRPLATVGLALGLGILIGAAWRR